MLCRIFSFLLLLYSIQINLQIMLGFVYVPPSNHFKKSLSQRQFFATEASLPVLRIFNTQLLSMNTSSQLMISQLLDNIKSIPFSVRTYTSFSEESKLWINMREQCLLTINHSNYYCTFHRIVSFRINSDDTCNPFEILRVFQSVSDF